MIVQKDKVNLDKDNFRTSLFIMAFLAIPLILVVVLATLVRLKNMGRLSHIGRDSKHIELGKWMNNKKSTPNASSRKRNGFMRLNQESDNEEAERLNVPDDATANGLNRTDSDSDSEVEISLPTISKA